MRGIRESIRKDEFPLFVQNFMDLQYPARDYPKWAVEALASVNIQLKSPNDKESSSIVSWPHSMFCFLTNLGSQILV